MSKERAMELLNALIEHMLVAERSSTVIKQLLSIGFEEEELVEYFHFCRNDVKEISEYMEILNKEELN